MGSVRRQQLGVKSRSDFAADRLKMSILEGELRPGDRLVPGVLGEAWGISQTPMREAFQRLAATGLIELVDQKGARVTAISPDDCADLFGLRSVLEAQALTSSLAEADSAWQRDLNESYDTLSDVLTDAYTEDADSLDRFDRAHRAFHLALIGAAPGHWLKHVIELLMDNSLRYRVTTLNRRGTAAALLDEHKAMLDAAMAGDAELLARLNHEHLWKTVEVTREMSADSL